MRSRLTVTAVIVTALTLGCLGDAGPTLLIGRFQVVPTFDAAVTGIVPLAAARVTLDRGDDGDLVVDTVVDVLPGDTVVDLSVSVVMFFADESFLLNSQLVTPTGDTAFRAGPVSVTPGVGGVQDVPAIDLPFVYEGVGMEARAVRILTPDTNAFAGDPLLLEAVALDSLAQPIAGTPIAWTSLDGAVAAATTLAPPAYRGEVVGASRGVARVVATLLTGYADTGSVTIQPRPSTIAVSSGDGQTARPGALLRDSVVIEVRGNDALGVAGVSVQFVPANGGTVTPNSAVTDQAGQAYFFWSLGPASGTQTVSVQAVGFPGVQTDVSATATVVGPGVIWSTGNDGLDMATIDPATGGGTTVGATGFSQGWAAAFDTDGTLYTLVNGFSGNATLATVNLSTGVATTIGSGVGTSMISLEFDAAGNLYGIGYNDQLLYQIDKALGTAVSIGSTGIGLNMDLAFNSAGVLFATVSNNIWTVDPATGATTLLGSISGVCAGGEIMGIMFDANDILYATNYASSTQSCLMTIDLEILTATVVGLTGLDFPHGGDIP